MIKDRLVCGIENDKLRRSLLREDKLTLQKAIELCQISELSEQRMKELTTTSAVHEVTYPRKKDPSNRQRQQRQQASNNRKESGKNPQMAKSNDEEHRQRQCSYCGNVHKQKNCPAYGKKCRACGKLNHFERVCRSTARGTKGRQSVNSITEERQGIQPFLIDMLSAHDIQAINHDTLSITLEVQSKPLKLKVDTGARCNVLPKHILDSLNICNNMDYTKKVKLISYSGDTIDTIGQISLSCKYNGEVYNLLFQVIDQSFEPIIGLQSSLDLNVVTINNVDSVLQSSDTCKSHTNYTIMSKAYIGECYKDIFGTDLGKLPVEYHMKIDPDVKPVVRPPRRIPVAMQSKVKEELERMVNMGVIKPVTEPTSWVSSFVAVMKKGKDEIRLCIDPKDLNRAILRQHYPMRTIEEVAARMPNAKFFTVLDASSGFWQIPLDYESSLKTTFNTPYGRYCFCRLPFGIKSASEVFQKAMDHLLEGYPCEVIVDDILIWGATETEHDANLTKVLDRIREINLKLKWDKCKVKVREVGYVGHLLTAEGLKPDPEKIRAIVEIKTPENVKDIQRFLGMVRYLSKFVPRLSELALPLQSLTHIDTPWTWDSVHQRAFENLKSAISSTPALRFYDVSKQVTLTCDASFGGIGAACLQDGIPVAYASRSLTKTEQNYAQIEKELLAVTFACNKFHDYIIGKNVTVETDHKPLEVIMKKPLLTAPMRLQRMMLQLQRYDLTLVYKKGSQLFIADTLSRAQLSETSPADIYEDYQVLTVTPVGSHKMAELQGETAMDPVMMQLASVILHGWPENESDVSADLKPYFKVRDQLATRDGVIYKGEKVVVPASLRSDYLRRVHVGHIGIESTKRRARDILYWPEMSKDIESLVRACSVCNSCKPHQQREPLKMHDIPERPWSLVATDLFHWNGEEYVIVTDSFSGWIEIIKLSNTSSRAIIDKLKEVFARFGIPDILYSDNGPQYSSEEFQMFAREWGFNHVTSSPQYPQSNGLAERAVRSAKELLEKCERDGTNINLALLSQRNTPRDEVLGSPAQRLMSRRLKSTVPCSDKLLECQQFDGSMVKDRLNQKSQQQKKFYDKQTKCLPTLKSGDVIRMQTSKGYDKLGFVVRAAEQPRSFLVKSQGQEYRRNRRHLLKVPEQSEVVTEKNVVVEESPAAEELPKIKETETEKYSNVVITRSGRISKPNPKYTS